VYIDAHAVMRATWCGGPVARESHPNSSNQGGTPRARLSTSRLRRTYEPARPAVSNPYERSA
jgi:hypothetical protein